MEDTRDDRILRYAALFFFAFLPQFVCANEPRPLARMLELSTGFMVLTFAVFIGAWLFAAWFWRRGLHNYTGASA